MALPTIQIDSATGSDTQASGAGPATALFGTGNASSNGTGLIVTLGGAPDLSGVAADGSAVLYFADPTAGARNFGKITAVDNGAKTVTVANAFGATSLNRDWAIGGKRASLGSTSSRKLAENNSAAGDAMPGWIIECSSGHAETLTTALNFRRAGDTTDGPIILRTAAGYTTRATFTWSADVIMFGILATGIAFEDIILENTNVAKTASIAIRLNSATSTFRARRCRLGSTTNKVTQGVAQATTTSFTLEECEIIAANIGVNDTSGAGNRLLNCYIHDCGSHGVVWNAGSNLFVGDIFGCVIYNNAGDGINSTGAGTTATNIHGPRIRNNTIVYNTGDGIEFGAGATATNAWQGCLVENNIIGGNGGIGINASNAAATAAVLSVFGSIFRNNVLFSNTGGNMSSAVDAVDTLPLLLDPLLIGRTQGDFTPSNPALINSGYPNTAVAGRVKPSYTAIGAISPYAWAAPGRGRRRSA